MSRTASMTVSQAVALLGPSEGFNIDSTKRAIVRKWAVAAGHPGKTVYRMNNKALEALYRSGKIVAAAPVIPLPPRAAKENPSEMLASLIKMIAGNAPVDENRVNEMITDALAKFQPETSVITTRLEIAFNGKVNSVDGYQHAVTSKVIKIVALNHPCMMIGPAGCGKTTVGQTVSIALGLPFYITSTVLDTHELMGFIDGHGVYHSTAFRKAYETGGVWVADELDAWDAAALLAANSAIANGICTFPDSETPVVRHADFRIIATANTYGHGADRMYVGRNELDAASLDRFATVAVDYDTSLEMILQTNENWMQRVWEVRAACRKNSIRHIVSTRAILMGQAALAAGFTTAEVEEMYLFKGMSKNDRKMIA